MTDNASLKILEAKARDPASNCDALPGLAGKAPSVDRLLARHANASPSLLEQLSRSSDRATRKAVAMHPNAAKEVLVRLALQFPAEFFKNPAFEWLLIEDPTLLNRVGDSVLLNILKRADCPVALLKWAVGRRESYTPARTSPQTQRRLAAAMNPAIPVGLLRRLIRIDGDVGEAARWHRAIATPDDVRLEQTFESCLQGSLSEIGTSNAACEWRLGRLGPAQWLSLNLETRLQCPFELKPKDVVKAVLPEHARKLSAHPVARVRCELAADHTTPSDLLDSLSRDSVEAVRAAVAGNPAAWPATLESLSCDTSQDVRLQLAGNASTPALVLSGLANFREEEARLWLAANPSTPPDVLESLSNSRSAEIREAVAGNESTEPSVLTRLASDRAGNVRDSVARNPGTPAETLLLMASTDKRNRLAFWFAGNPKAPDALRAASCRVIALDDCDHRHSMRRHAAECPACPSDLMDQLSNDKVSDVRRAVAGNPSSSLVILERLARDRTKSVSVEAKARLLDGCNVTKPEEGDERHAARRWQLALRKAAKRWAWNAPNDVLMEHEPTALVDIYRDECLKLLCHPESSILAQMMGATRRNPCALSGNKARLAVRSPVPAVRLLGLCNAHADRIDLARGARSTHWQERMAVARNPSTPSGVLASLSKGAHRLVAMQAELMQQMRSNRELTPRNRHADH